LKTCRKITLLITAMRSRKAAETDVPMILPTS
jgi:hypothetical protein